MYVLNAKGDGQTNRWASLIQRQEWFPSLVRRRNMTYYGLNTPTAHCTLTKEHAHTLQSYGWAKNKQTETNRQSNNRELRHMCQPAYPEDKAESKNKN